MFLLFCTIIGAQSGIALERLTHDKSAICIRKKHNFLCENRTTYAQMQLGSIKKYILRHGSHEAKSFRGR